MTAFYELHMEQGATFVVPMKIVKTDGDLFRFIPPAANFNNGTKLNFWWRNFNTTPILNFDIPEELLITNPNAFSWLKDTTAAPLSNYADKTVLKIKMQIKTRKGDAVANNKYFGSTSYKAFKPSSPANSSWTYEQIYNQIDGNTGALKIQLFTDNTTVVGGVVPDREWNLLMSIEGHKAGIEGGVRDLNGKYIFDAEIDYYPDNNSNQPGVGTNSTNPYTIRLIQGLINVNPNVTT